MDIRPVTPNDLDSLAEIDGTIESSRYLHVDRSGEGLDVKWKIEERLLRTKLIEPNPLNEDLRFTIRQIAAGIEEGLTLMAEHDGIAAALLVAQADPERGVMRLVELRVDSDNRREGLATGMIYQVIQIARDAGLRAVYAESRANQWPAAQLMLKTGFDIAGLDTHRRSNHDLVKEAVTLFWYVAVD